MPDRRAHRGPHGDDARQFRDAVLVDLRAAVDDLCWLFSRGYAERSATKLVGDRYQLNKRQRLAVSRCACSEQEAADRKSRMLAATNLSATEFAVDGFNLLVTVEAALSGGLILESRDGCFRDLASVHGTYRKVVETLQALMHIGETMNALGVLGCVWYLDRPVSNSGRLAQLVTKTANEQGWNWQVELVDNPDRELSESSDVVVSADSVVLDRCQAWFNLAREVVESKIPEAWVVRL